MGRYRGILLGGFFVGIFIRKKSQEFVDLLHPIAVGMDNVTGENRPCEEKNPKCRGKPNDWRNKLTI